MAQINIHPEIRDVMYKFSQGRSLKLRSTYKRNKEFLLEADIFSHPAWKEDSKAIDNTSTSVNKFNDTFGGVSLLGNIGVGTSSVKVPPKEILLDKNLQKEEEDELKQVPFKSSAKKSTSKK